MGLSPVDAEADSFNVLLRPLQEAGGCTLRAGHAQRPTQPWHMLVQGKALHAHSPNPQAALHRWP